MGQAPGTTEPSFVLDCCPKVDFGSCHEIFREFGAQGWNCWNEGEKCFPGMEGAKFRNQWVENGSEGGDSKGGECKELH